MPMGRRTRGTAVLLIAKVAAPRHHEQAVAALALERDDVHIEHALGLGGRQVRAHMLAVCARDTLRVALCSARAWPVSYQSGA